MRKILGLLAASLIVGSPALAGTMAAFGTPKHDGVYALSAEQAAYLGADGATYIGMLGLHLNGSERRAAASGSVFDDGTVMSSLHRATDPASVLGLVNGDAIGLDYAGGYMQPLGETGFASVQGDYVRAVGVLFADAPVRFKGMRGFDRRDSAGLLAYLVPDRIVFGDPAYRAGPDGNVPVPPAAAALGTALAGLGGIAALRRRTRARG